MLIYFFYNLVSAQWYFLMLLLLNIFSIKYLLLSNIPDLYTRLICNDFFTSSYYFFWTNLFYLIFFFLIVILSYLTFKNIFINKEIYYILYLSLCNILLIYKDFFMCNIALSYYNFSENLNPLLLNSINKFHPLILYISFVIFFTIMQHYITSIQKNLGNFYILSLIKTCSTTILFTLYLGSWWALQEGSWGGWWNWDASEVFGLLILLKIISFFHIIYYLYFSTLYQYFIKTSLLGFLVFYLLMQLNFTFISHNFGFRTFKFTMLDLNLIITIGIALLVLRIVITNTNLNFTYLIKCYRFITFIVQPYSLVILSILVYSSLILLINDLMWHNAGINFINSIINYRVIFLLNFTFIYLYFFNYTPVLLLMYTYSLISNTLSLFFINFFHKINLYKCLHYTFLVTTFLVILNNESILNTQCFLNWFYTNFSILSLVVNSISLENSFNYINLSSGWEGKTFLLYHQEATLLQLFVPYYNDVNLYIKITDILPSNLTTLYCCIFYFYIIWVHYVIIF